MKKSKFFFAIILLLGFISSCKPKSDSKEVSAGDIDASRFVAVGGSVTAGFMDDALYAEGQEFSLGNLLANQLKLVGTTEFLQPLMPGGNVGCNADGLSVLILGYKTDCLGATSLSPVRKALNGDVSSFAQNVYANGFHNYGIPGLSVLKMTQNGYGSSNPYFARMTASAASDQVLSQIIAKSPSFFSFFVGMDDVLEYAKKGAKTGSLPPLAGPNSVGFSGSVANALDAMMANGAKGIVATIPDVTDLPYFTTIPYNGLNLTPEKVDTLNLIYNPLGFSFQLGNNAFMIEDPNAGSFGVRQIEPDELILLSTPLDSVKCYKMGSVFPFRDEFVLTSAELNEIRSTIIAYNNELIALANQRNLAIVDLNDYFKKLKNGIVYNGISLSLKFVSGGMISLDGINPTPRGNALLANEFIKAMNAKFNAKIPLLNATNYRSVIFP
jgi:hypothetical protein